MNDEKKRDRRESAAKPISKEIRKCGSCGAPDMVVIKAEQTPYNFYLTFECPHCGSSILLESPGLAGLRTVLYLALGVGYLIAIKFYEIKIDAVGVALFSILAVLTLWNGVCALAPHMHCPRTSTERYMPDDVVPPKGLFDIRARLRYLKYDTFWSGVFSGLAAIAALGFVVVLVALVLGS